MVMVHSGDRNCVDTSDSPIHISSLYLPISVLQRSIFVFSNSLIRNLSRNMLKSSDSHVRTEIFIILAKHLIRDKIRHTLQFLYFFKNCAHAYLVLN